AVRDELLGLPVKDRDWVVVGATPEEMIAKGFKPVGKDFPVFLHPSSKEEYALASTERKSGRGYKGFTVHAAPEVTLEDDLKRRDLTINAMAKAEDGTLIDPFGGRRDLKEGVLRHVSRAFAEDPVRILRVARFAARFGFRVADETMQLMKAMVNSGEADFLVPERVWQEFSRGLAEPHPERMFEVLEACGLRQQLLPELKAVPKKLSGSVPVRFALLAWPLKEAEVNALCERLRAPGEEPARRAAARAVPARARVRLPRLGARFRLAGALRFRGVGRGRGGACRFRRRAQSVGDSHVSRQHLAGSRHRAARCARLWRAGEAAVARRGVEREPTVVRAGGPRRERARRGRAVDPRWLDPDRLGARRRGGHGRAPPAAVPGHACGRRDDRHRVLRVSRDRRLAAERRAGRGSGRRPRRRARVSPAGAADRARARRAAARPPRRAGAVLRRLRA